MKKLIFIFLAVPILLSACANPSATQVTVTSEVTFTSTPLPTETPIPTPTLHPQFTALQEQIAASGGRFILHPDGMISDGAEPIPGLTVSPDGTMTLTVNGEAVILDPTKAVFDDENGFSYPGYEQNVDGDWVEAVSPEQQQLAADLKNFITVMETYALGETDGKTVVLTDKKSGEVKFNFAVGGDGSLTDPVTGEVVYKNGRWDLSYTRTLIKESGNCKVTEWKGNLGEEAGPALPKSGLKEFTDRYVMPLYEYYKAMVKQHVFPSYGNAQIVIEYFGDGCWGIVPLREDTQTESAMFWKDRVGRSKYIDVFLTSKRE